MRDFNTSSGCDWGKYLEQKDSAHRKADDNGSHINFLESQIKTLKKENTELKKKLGIKGEYVYNGHVGTMVWEQF